MAHEKEKDFEDRVVEWLEEEYGEENVERQKYLKESGRFADVWVEGPLVNFAIEIESRFSAVFKGVGQSIVYSKHEEGTVPVIMIKEGHIQQPEADMIREDVILKELDI